MVLQLRSVSPRAALPRYAERLLTKDAEMDGGDDHRPKDSKTVLSQRIRRQTFLIRCVAVIVITAKRSEYSYGYFEFQYVLLV